MDALESCVPTPLMALSMPASLSSKAANDKKTGQEYHFSDIIGKNPYLSELITSAKQASKTHSSILLVGETGVGKEIFAKSIHNHSPRRKQNFTAINCSAVPEALLEGILFGTAKGAFTGAVDRAGLFENAHGGTIFLDEVDSMPIGLQSKLLRVLQEKCVRRVGDLHEREVDVKIISSVGRSPDEGIRQGVLRKDFFYRIGVVQLHIPPLRQRMEDILPLAQHFVKKHCKKLDIVPPLITPEVMASFYSYDWPGNVRELEHVIEASLNLLGNEDCLTMEHIRKTCPDMLKQISEPRTTNDVTANHHIPLTVRGNGPDMAASAMETTFFQVGEEAPVKNESGKPYSIIKKRTEMELLDIRKALKLAGGQVATASRLLGISPQSLHYRLKKYCIDPKNFVPKQLD